MREVIIDTNIFILYFSGRINKNRIAQYTRNEIYTIDHFNHLLALLSRFERIVTCPNIFTEIDNLLNGIRGEDKTKYCLLAKEIAENSIEKYFSTKDAIADYHFREIGLTDTIVLTMAKSCELLISADSELCDFAKSLDIPTFDFKEYINKTLK